MAKANENPQSNPPVKSETQAPVDPQGDKKFKDKLADLKTRSVSLVGNFIEIHWEAGEFAQSLLDQPGQWGSHTVEELGKELEWSESSVRASIRFFNRYTRSQMESVAKKAIPWRTVAVMTAIEDKKQRADVEAAVAKKEMTHEQVTALAKSLTEKSKTAKKAAGKKPGTTAVPPIRMFKSTGVAADKLNTFLSDMNKNLKEFEGMEDGDRKAATSKQLTTTRNSLKKVYTQLGKLLEKLEA